MAYQPNNPNGQATSANSAPVVIASNQSEVAIALSTSQTDLHGQTLGVSRLTQITAKFFQQAPSNFLNITTSGGATATGPTIGLGVFATGTATTASLLGQTPTTVMYATSYETWASQAAAFTAPTSAASFQRIGIYDAVNGYFFGYSGLTFGLTIRSNSVDTFIAQTAWNIDTLAGAATSKFTSNSAPVALVPANINMYRVRYGWYGAVSARLEVYAPDGNWILVHRVRTANTQTAANITTPDLPMTIEVSKTAADATNLIITCGGWAAGITAPSTGFSLSGQGSIAALNALVSIPITGVATLSFSATGTWVGTLAFQYSLDGLAWTADAALNNVTGVFPSTITANGAFTASIGSYKFYRIIATAWTSGSASIVYNTSPLVSFAVSQSLITDGANNGPVTVKPASTAALTTDASLVVALHPASPLPAGVSAIGNINELRASTLAATVTAAAGTAVTLTLPAVAARFHYITALDIVLYSAAARTGSATPNIVTTTNLPGTVSFTFSTAGAIGATDIQSLVRVTPLKSAVLNTATTIVAPIAAGGIWTITATYFTGA